MSTSQRFMVALAVLLATGCGDEGREVARKAEPNFTERLEAVEQLANEAKDEAAKAQGAASEAKEEVAKVRGEIPEPVAIPDRLAERLDAAESDAAKAKGLGAAAHAKAGEALVLANSNKATLEAVNDALSVDALDALAAYRVGKGPGIDVLELFAMSGVVTTPSSAEVRRKAAELSQEKEQNLATAEAAEAEAAELEAQAAQAWEVHKNAEAAADAALGTGIDPIKLRSMALEAKERAEKLSADAALARQTAAAKRNSASESAAMADELARLEAYLVDMDARLAAVR